MLPKVYLILITSLASIVTSHLLLKRHIDFRERFLERRRQREIKDQRIMILDRYKKDAETLDDILHYRISLETKSQNWQRISDIENDFRRLIAMEGTKYNYKRDMYWRTWRKVLSDEGDEKLVCYKCNNPIVVNTTGCGNCGMWTIEEGPSPCPYEFFSVIDDLKLCGANYTQFNDIHNDCPSIIPFSDMLAKCDNPIETVWRFSKLYGTSGEYDNVICNGQDFCEIFTTYEITPQQVIFRIINSTNDVMYSRIMKPNNTNFVCVDDCGHYNSYTKKVTKSDRPLKLDLLTSRINKREDAINDAVESLIFGMHTIGHREMSTEMSLSKNGAEKQRIFKNKLKSKLMKRHQNNEDFDNNLISKHMISFDGTMPKPSQVSHCKKMENEFHVSEEQNEENLYS